MKTRVLLISLSMVSLAIAGCLEEDEVHPEASFAAPQVSQWDEVNFTVWHVVADINRICPEDAEIPWSDLRLVVYDKSGIVILPPQPLKEGTGSECSTSPIVWFVERSGNANINPGDGIKLTGIDRTYEGGTIELRLDGKKFASATLPKEFL